MENKVLVRHDTFRGWVVTCPVCKEIAVMRKFWDASRIRDAHADAWPEHETPGHESLAEPPRPGV